AGRRHQGRAGGARPPGRGRDHPRDAGVISGIDHLVIAVDDPDGAAEAMEADLGLAVSGGGRHEGAGTHNRLAFLGDTYLELIGVYDRAMVAASPSSAVGQATLRVLDEGREGLATYALVTDDAAAEVARLRSLGSPIGDASPGSRTRPDGEVVRWVCAFPDLGPAEPPFLIEHEPGGAEWGAEARQARAAFRHPVGGTVRLAGLAIPVPDPGEVAARYRRVLGLELGADRRALVGNQGIRLVSREEAPRPVVELAAEPGTEPLDLVRFGIRWRRRPASAA
ncbi:MAG TPA: VOC family protein, partial [Candidatus Limnocylindrales bacterium]|nr:VOC family protein [Candidatus Limnocylindrales bacterium]